MSEETTKPTVSRVSVDFNQEGNTLGTTENEETITINLEFQLPGKEPFIIIKTKGWSMDNISELNSLINRTKRILR